MSLRERARPGLGIIEPCLPSPAKAPPSGPGWIHEIKHDGFRIMARRDGAGVRLITRNGNDFTARFPLAVDAVTRLPAHSFLLDGEGRRFAMSHIDDVRRQPGTSNVYLGNTPPDDKSYRKLMPITMAMAPR
jgi:ATP-dependent DNA ligase